VEIACGYQGPVPANLNAGFRSAAANGNIDLMLYLNAVRAVDTEAADENWWTELAYAVDAGQFDSPAVVNGR
jgi:hypothetical protein